MTVMLNSIVSIRAPNTHNPKGLHIKRKQRSQGYSIGAAQKASLIHRARPKRPTLKKMVPDKADIKKYCRQHPQFREVDDFISNAIKCGDGRGVSLASSHRAQLKAQILRDLPFGEILK